MGKRVSSRFNRMCWNGREYLPKPTRALFRRALKPEERDEDIILPVVWGIRAVINFFSITLTISSLPN